MVIRLLEVILEPDQSDLLKILNIRTHSLKLQLMQIVGHVNYYYQLIRDYSELINSLTDLLKCDSKRKIHWTTQHDKVLVMIKQLRLSH